MEQELKKVEQTESNKKEKEDMPLQQDVSQTRQKYENSLQTKQDFLTLILFMRKISKQGNTNKAAECFSKIPLLMSKYEIYTNLSYEKNRILFKIESRKNQICLFNVKTKQYFTVNLGFNTTYGCRGIIHKKFIYLVDICHQVKQLDLSNLQEIQDTQDVKKIDLPELNTPRKQSGLAVFQNHLYVIGGFAERELSDCEKIQVSQFENSQWSRISKLNIPRTNLNVVINKQYIYAIGGKEKTIEYYDSKKDCWKLASFTLPLTLYDFSCCLQPFIIIGGCSFVTSYNNSWFKLNEQTEEWEEKKLNFTIRSTSPCVAYKHFIYIYREDINIIYEIDWKSNIVKSFFNKQ